MKKWGERRGSNPRHPGPQPGALPAELRPPCSLVGRSLPCDQVKYKTAQIFELYPECGPILKLKAGLYKNSSSLCSYKNGYELRASHEIGFKWSVSERTFR